MQNLTRAAIRVLFALPAMALGLISVRMIDLKTGAGLSHTELSYLILTAAPGVILGLLLATRIARAITLHWLVAISICGVALSFLALSALPPLPVLFLCEAIFGFCAGLFEVAANTIAQAIDRQNKPIMSSCHGFWSIGMMAGGFLGGLLASLGVGFFAQQLLLTPFILLPAMILVRYLPKSAIATEQKSAWPGPYILPFCLIPFAALFIEGAITDWSSVFLSEERGFDPLATGFAISAFMGGMAASRLTGDHLRALMQPHILLALSTALSLAGMASFVLSGTVIFIALGALLAGIGVGNVYPLTLVLANQGRSEEEAASIISSIALLSFSAFSIAPVLMGFVGEYWGLGRAFSFTIPLLALTYLWQLWARKITGV